MEDDDLLAATPRDPDAFAAFYRRHAAPLTRFFLRRTGSAEIAADLTAETFAQALVAARRFDRRRGSAAAFLYGIAHREWATALERRRVADRARRRLRMPRIELDDEAIERIVEGAGDAATAARLDALLAALPREQRAAIEAHVVDERAYRDIAAAIQVSPAVVRKRVSRGLAELRTRLIEEDPR